VKVPERGSRSLAAGRLHTPSLRPDATIDADANMVVLLCFTMTILLCMF
jgi:hypothetical protein